MTDKTLNRVFLWVMAVFGGVVVFLLIALLKGCAGENTSVEIYSADCTEDTHIGADNAEKEEEPPECL